MELPLGRKRQIARAANISPGYLTQLLSGKIYNGNTKPRQASWTVYERLAAATQTNPELWARNLARNTPHLIVAAIIQADHTQGATHF